ncbi:glutamyl-tRNA reductase [Humidisolicoccus flavus]|uniref:glutamyl-tRNA reductase n=1 Tax=Humidisolicoccus flavus TaxID=3111414 RepID=UPI00324FE9A9
MLICLSASHQNADFTVLEQLAAVDPRETQRRLAESRDVSGAIVFSTCNRFEAYLDVEEPSGDDTQEHSTIVSSAFNAMFGAMRELDDHVQVLEPRLGTEAAEHLFSVAAGLESVVVGEGEIAGQVRRALSSAQHDSTTSPDLERLFQRASETQRAIKNRTGLGAAGRSIVRLALGLANHRVNDWASTRILLVGTGRFAAASLAAVRDLGATNIEVWSPSARGSHFARKHGIANVDGRDAVLAAATADVILTCTTSEEHVITAEMLREGRARLAGTHALPSMPFSHDSYSTDAAAECPVGHETAAAQQCPLDASLGEHAHDGACPVEHGRARQLIIDMGLPRNVNPDVVAVPGVELLDLETIRLHAPIEHLTATDDARAIVQKAARTFARVSAENELNPAIRALRDHVTEAMEAEIARVQKRGSESEAKAAEAALRHFAGVLLHKPTTRARELARGGRSEAYVAALDALFGIEAPLPGLSLVNDNDDTSSVA